MATLTIATLNKMIAEKGATVTLEGAKFRYTLLKMKTVLLLKHYIIL